MDKGHVSNQFADGNRKWCICWGLILAGEFGALASIYSSRMVINWSRRFSYTETWWAVLGKWLEKRGHLQKWLGRWLDEPSVYYRLTSTYQSEPDLVTQTLATVSLEKTENTFCIAKILQCCSMLAAATLTCLEEVTAVFKRTLLTPKPCHLGSDRDALLAAWQDGLLCECSCLINLAIGIRGQDVWKGSRQKHPRHMPWASLQLATDRGEGILTAYIKIMFNTHFKTFFKK